MSDILYDAPPGASSPRDPDAPPLSAGRSSAGQSGGVDAHPVPPPISDEVKARLDKVVYSDVCGDAK